MSIKVKTNRSKQIAFHVKPKQSSIDFTLVIPMITIVITVNRSHKKPKPSSDMVQTPGQVDRLEQADIRALQPKEYQPLIKRIRRLILWNTLSHILILFLIPAFICLFIDAVPAYITILAAVIGLLGSLLKIYTHTIGRVNLSYEVTAQEQDISEYREMLEAANLWQVLSITKVKDTRENAGFPCIYDLYEITMKSKAPFYLKTNAEVVQLHLQGEMLILLPDIYLIIRKSKVGIIRRSNVTVTRDTIEYPETEDIATDAKVLRYVWKYVNKDGSPDQRFKGNGKMPVYGFGVVTMEARGGWRVVVWCL